jgi:hypothetical protein
MNLTRLAEALEGSSARNVVEERHRAKDDPAPDEEPEGRAASIVARAQKAFEGLHTGAPETHRHRVGYPAALCPTALVAVPKLGFLRTSPTREGVLATVETPKSVWAFDGSAPRCHEACDVALAGTKVIPVASNVGLGRWHRVSRTVYLWMYAPPAEPSSVELDGGEFDAVYRVMEKVQLRRRIVLPSGMRWDEPGGRPVDDLRETRASAGIYDDDALGWMANEAWGTLVRHQTPREALRAHGLVGAIVVFDQDWPRGRVLVTSRKMLRASARLAENVGRIDGAVGRPYEVSEALVRQQDADHRPGELRKLLGLFEASCPAPLGTIPYANRGDLQACVPADLQGFSPQIMGANERASLIASVRRRVDADSYADRVWSTVGLWDIPLNTVTGINRSKAILGQTLTTDTPSVIRVDPLQGTRWRFRPTDVIYRVASSDAPPVGPVLICEDVPSVRLPMKTGFVFTTDRWELMPAAGDLGDLSPAPRLARVLAGISVLREVMALCGPDAAARLGAIVGILEASLDGPEPVPVRPLDPLLLAIEEAQKHGKGPVAAADLLAWMLVGPGLDAHLLLKRLRDGYFALPLEAERKAGSDTQQSVHAVTGPASAKNASVVITDGVVLVDFTRGLANEHRITIEPGVPVHVEIPKGTRLFFLTDGIFEVRGECVRITVGDDPAFLLPAGSQLWRSGRLEKGGDR